MKQILFSLLFISCITLCKPAHRVQIMHEKCDIGQLTVICGPMFAGKSEELIRVIRRAQYAQKIVLVVKHEFDDRTSATDVASHNGNTITAHPVTDAEDIIRLAHESDCDILCIDEVQFFSDNIVAVICKLLDEGIEIIVSGLDQDFRAMPFGQMPTLLALADEVIKLTAICTACGQQAQKSQRLINGEPAKFDDPILLVGAQESYQARCRNCFYIDKKGY